MTGPAIRARGLGKRYRIGDAVRYQTLRESIMTAGRRAASRLAGRAEASESFVWALRDVDLDVEQGEVLGVIGRNGAGKTTLLKILSRITDPTLGEVEVVGRVGSLLEVGTGFHAELTGRENIFMNGAILGMRREEIRKNFDRIVEFSGIEKFIDTPVKRYSTGMCVRLAFAVAAHLDTEILLLDEVFAVGDHDFQKKCIESVRSATVHGRTVMIVAHNLGLIESLCSKAILIHEGRILEHGSAAEVTAKYLGHATAGLSTDLAHRERRDGSPSRFVSARVKGISGAKSAELAMGEGIEVTLGIDALEPVNYPWITVELRTALNQLVFRFSNREAGFVLEPLTGKCAVKCRVPRLNILPGRYYLDLILWDRNRIVLDSVPAAAFFDVREEDIFRSGIVMTHHHGTAWFESNWELEKIG